MKSISANDLKEKLDSNEDIQLIDVRETFEYDICHLNAVHIPMNTIPQHVDKISKDKPVIVYCHHGMRSAHVIDYLEQQEGFDNLYNLVGGIHAWATQIDLSMPVY